MTMALDDLNDIISRINDVSPSNREAWLAALGSAIRERDELQQKLRLAYKDLSDDSQLIHAADGLRKKAEADLAALRTRITGAPTGTLLVNYSHGQPISASIAADAGEALAAIDRRSVRLVVEE